MAEKHVATLYDGLFGTGSSAVGSKRGQIAMLEVCTKEGKSKKKKVVGGGRGDKIVGPFTGCLLAG